MALVAPFTIAEKKPFIFDVKINYDALIYIVNNII